MLKSALKIIIFSKNMSLELKYWNNFYVALTKIHTFYICLPWWVITYLNIVFVPKQYGWTHVPSDSIVTSPQMNFEPENIRLCRASIKISYVQKTFIFYDYLVVFWKGSFILWWSFDLLLLETVGQKRINKNKKQHSVLRSSWPLSLPTGVATALKSSLRVCHWLKYNNDRFVSRMNRENY